jgi:hypothetical protein
MENPTPRERGILETMERGNRIWEVPGKNYYTLYNDKTERDRVVSRATVAEMERAGWIQKAEDLPQRLDSWEITEGGRAIFSTSAQM